MNLLSSTILILFGLSGLNAQLTVPGKYRHLVQTSFQKSGNATASIKEYRLPEQDNAALLAKAKANEQITSVKLSRKEIRRNATDGLQEFAYNDKKTPKTVPFTFGKDIPLNINMANPGDGEWIVNEVTKTKMWRFKVSSKDARAMSLYFSDFFMAPASELYIIGREDTLGAFTEANNKADRAFGIAPVSGDFLILEHIEPLETSVTSSIVVSHSVHTFRSTPFFFKTDSDDDDDDDDEAGACNINVACPEGAGKADSINSVAILITGKGVSFCTGAMINNGKRDGRQLLLTAEHCIGSDKVTNTMFGFHFQYKYCDSKYETKPTFQTVHGAKLLGKSEETDYALLEVVEKIPDDWDVYMSGWSATGPNQRTGSFYGIHHPSGDAKKVSISTGAIELVRVMDFGTGANFWKVDWSRGVTEPGSSGSPLFDSNGLIIGHLLGGDSSCERPKLPDLYGALMRDWDLSRSPISRFLDPLGTTAKQIGGASLKDLRSRPAVIEPVRPVEPSSPMPNQNPPSPRVTVTVTQNILNNVISTTTIAKTTQIITSRVTVTTAVDKVTYTKDVYKTVTATATVTTTFTRVPPPVVSVRTVTVKA